MKYGILFSVVAVLLTYTAIKFGGWYFILLWPSFSFAYTASGYLHFGPSVYGKSKNGILSMTSSLMLLPYLLYLWSVWHAIRIFKRESALDQLCDNIYIGRRLLGHELPPNIDHVIDLTCEFSEPNRLRSVDYHSFQILDGFVPSNTQLQSWVTKTEAMKGTIYIHCAEGHGRTGLFAAALLLKMGIFTNADQSLDFVISKRPLVHLNTHQTAFLREVARSMNV